MMVVKFGGFKAKSSSATCHGGLLQRQLKVEASKEPKIEIVDGVRNGE